MFPSISEMEWEMFLFWFGHRVPVEKYPEADWWVLETIETDFGDIDVWMN